jgi:hypothetical protein
VGEQSAQRILFALFGKEHSFTDEASRDSALKAKLRAQELAHEQPQRHRASIAVIQSLRNVPESLTQIVQLRPRNGARGLPIQVPVLARPLDHEHGEPRCFSELGDVILRRRFAKEAERLVHDRLRIVPACAVTPLPVSIVEGDAEHDYCGPLRIRHGL